MALEPTEKQCNSLGQQLGLVEQVGSSLWQNVMQINPFLPVKFDNGQATGSFISPLGWG